MTENEICNYLGVWCNDVNKTEDGNERYTDKPHDDFLPQRQRLEKAHLRSIPDACQMLLTVGMSHELQQQQQQPVQ